MILVVRYVLGALLLLAAVGKLRSFPAFRQSLSAYGLRGVGTATAATVSLVAAEAALAVLAWAPALVTSFVAGVLGAALGLVFTAAQTYALATGQRVSCLCFGTRSAEPVSVHTFAKAALVLACGLVLVAFGDPAAGGDTAFGFWEMAIALGAVVALSVADAQRRSGSGRASAIA